MPSLRLQRAVLLAQSHPFLALLGTVLVFSSYPIVAFVTLGPELASELLPRELTWTFYCLIFLPAGFGLLVSTLEPQLVRSSVRRNVIVFFFFLILLLFGAVIAISEDAEGPKDPIEISSENPTLQKKMYLADMCLRDWEKCKAKDSATYNALAVFEMPNKSKRPEVLETCRDEYGRKSANRDAVDPSLAENNDVWLFSMNRRHMYVCYYMKTLKGMGVTSLPKSPLGTTSDVLNLVSGMYILFFVIWVSYVFFQRKRVKNNQLVHRLLAAYSLFITWFFLRSWVEWDQWYGDLYHIPIYYTGFKIYFFFAFLCLLLLVPLFLHTKTRLTIRDSIAIVNFVIVGLIGGLGFYQKDAVELLFASIRHADGVLYLMTFVGVAGAVLLYFHAMIDDHHQNISPDNEPDK